MYCRNCGNKLLDDDNFCVECGKKIFKDISTKETSTKKDEVIVDKVVSKENLPMNWWNFICYVRFPLGFFLSLINISASLEYELDFFGKAFLAISIFLVIYMVVVFYFMAEKKKSGYKLLLIYFIVEILYSAMNNILLNTQLYYWEFTEVFVTFLLVIAFFGLIWFYPNYKYFTKRKEYFKN